MNDDYIFDEEVDEEAAAELAKRKANEAKNQEAPQAASTNQPGAEGSQQYNNTAGNSTSDSYSSQTTYNTSGTGNQGGYNSDYTYTQGQQPQQKAKKSGNGYAVASMILGIVTLVFFCSCINIVTGILALIFGIIHLTSYGKDGKGMAIAGLITSALGLIALVVCYVLIFSNSVNLSNMSDFPYELYEEYQYPEDLLDDLNYQDFQMDPFYPDGDSL